MLDVFLKTAPFFALIATGWLAAKSHFFPPEATRWLTKFVFYFALSAMLFRFAASLVLGGLFDFRFVLAYLTGSLLVWALAMMVARARGQPLSDSAMEAHSAMTGNTGFLGLPMLAILLGEAAIGPIMLMLVVDMIVFSTLVTLLITGARYGRISRSVIAPLLKGVLGNPMIMSMAAGLLWSASGSPLWQPVEDYLVLLGAAATPCALFAIGASLAEQSAGGRRASLWLSFCKLVLHPLAVGICALLVFGVTPFAAGVMIAAAALPVAGNVYILARHFDVAVQRVSAAILVSTAASILTLPLFIHLILKG